MSPPQRVERAQVYGVVEVELAELAVLLGAASAVEFDDDDDARQVVAELWGVLHRLEPDLAEAARQYGVAHGSIGAACATAELFIQLNNPEESTA